MLHSKCYWRAAGVWRPGSCSGERRRAQTVRADGTDEAKDGAGRKALEGDGEGAVREEPEIQERARISGRKGGASSFK